MIVVIPYRIVNVVRDVIVKFVKVIEMNDDMLLENLEEIALSFGDTNEIEIDSNLFIRLMSINCPKKLFEY